MKSRLIVPIVGSVLGVVALGGAALSLWGTDRHGDDATVAGLVRRLRDAEAATRRDAAITLGQVRGPRADLAASALILGLRDRDVEVRVCCARSLGTLAAANPGLDSIDTAATALARSLRDDEPRVRAWAALGLRSLGREVGGMFEAALDGLRGDDPFPRAMSEAALSSWPIRDANDLRRRLALLDDPAESVRAAMRSALTKPGATIAAEVALPVLAMILRTGSPPARELAATMLGRSVARVPAVRDTLMAVLRDREPGVRAIAAASLGAFSEDGLARVALRAAMDDPDLRVRATASASLAVGRRATRSEALADLKAALSGDAARAGVTEQIEADPVRAVPRLVAALRDRNPRVRAAAAIGLGEVAPRLGEVGPTIDALTLSLADRDPSVRRASAAALARFGPAASAAADALRRAIRDADRGVSAHALVALQALDGTRQSR